MDEFIEIKWNRPGKIRSNGRGSGIFANSVTDFRKHYGLVHLSVCSSLLRGWQNRTIQNFEWKISEEYNQQHFSWITQECQTSWLAPEQVPLHCFSFLSWLPVLILIIQYHSSTQMITFHFTDKIHRESIS